MSIRTDQVAWRCESCNSILGYIDGTDILRVKYKDLYFFVNVISGASQVKCLCRKCGNVNDLIVKSQRKMEAPSVVELKKLA